MEGAVTAEKSPRTIRTRIPQKYHAWQKKTAHGPSTGTDFAGPFTRMSHTRAARPGQARPGEAGGGGGGARVYLSSSQALSGVWRTNPYMLV